MNAPLAIPQPVTVVTRKRLPRAVIPGVAALLIAAAGTAWIRTPSSTESTDNAYVHADSTVASSRVGGTVARVLVRDNQQVRAGDPLIQIDSQEYDALIDEAKAAVADAEASVAGARAALKTFAADRHVAEADVAVAGSSVPAAEAEMHRAQADDARYRSLLGDGFVTRTDADRIAAAAIGAQAEYRRSITGLEASRGRASATASRIDTLVADQAKAEAGLARARASLALARQNLGFTLVRAAVPGIVGNRHARTGDLVKPGSELLTIVPSDGLYVVANFKETQTQRMQVGQPVDVTIDALDRQSIKGRVESFAPASGSEFALLPFEPGSGNFTKIVQRVAVRIGLDPAAGKLAHLRPGLSANASVRVNR